MHAGETVDRDSALARVMEQRQRGRSRGATIRALTAGAGMLIALVAVPLVVVAPELGIPALLLALRLLAVEFEWAARAYAWVVWRWGQAVAWYRGRSSAIRALVVVALVALAAGLLWLLWHALS